MWGVSDRFLSAITAPHKTETLLTCTVPGGRAETLGIKAGQVWADASARIRRKGNLEVFGTAAEFNMITTPGAEVRIVSGIRFGSDSELVPVFAGELVSGTQRLGNGNIRMSIADHGQWLDRTRFIAPFSPLATMTRREVIAAVVTAAKPDVLILDTATDNGLVGVKVWDLSRLDCISDLCTDGNMEAFFRPDGVFVIRDRPTILSAPVWSVSAGRGGTLKSVERERPLDKQYNTMVVRPSAADGSQSWVQQIAQVDDIESPRHPSRIGVVPKFWASPTIENAADALSVAHGMLSLVLGTTETLSLGSVSNPALDASDPIRITTPQVNEQPALTFQHFIDRVSFDLVTADMDASTRSQVVTDD